MANPHPVQTQAFIDAQQKPMETPYGPISAYPVNVRLPEQIDAAVRKKGDRSNWLRRVITDAIVREGAIKESPGEQSPGVGG